MGDRTALLINCSDEQARSVRQRAARERRTVSGYILNIVLRAVEFEDTLFVRHHRLTSLGTISPAGLRPPGKRTTLLIRCSTEEAQRVRTAAQRRDTTISAFVLFALRRAWEIADSLPKAPQPVRPQKNENET